MVKKKNLNYSHECIKQEAENLKNGILGEQGERIS